jgi:hypothetical protein
MSKTFAIMAAAAAILFSAATATLAAPQQNHDPIYFKLATGEQG